MIKKFVLNYIRTHLGHGGDNCRGEIFRAINEGLQNEFKEDSIPGLIYFGVSELLENDERFYRLVNSQDFSKDKGSYSSMLKSGIADEIDNLTVKLKVNKLPLNMMVATDSRKARWETFIVREINEIYKKYTTNKAAFLQNLKESKNTSPYDSVILTDMTEEDAGRFCTLLNKIADDISRFCMTIDENRNYYVYKDRVRSH